MAALVALAALSGCPGVARPLESPVVSVTIESVAITAEAPGSPDVPGFIEVHAALSCENRDAIAFTLRALDWELSLPGASPVRGRALLDAALPARGATRVPVVLRVPAGIGGSLAERWQSGERRLRVWGTAHFESPRGDVAAIFDRPVTVE